MYPESCISFLCDAGAGHFECLPETAEYIALFIRKVMILDLLFQIGDGDVVELVDEV